MNVADEGQLTSDDIVIPLGNVGDRDSCRATCNIKTTSKRATWRCKWGSEMHDENTRKLCLLVIRCSFVEELFK